MRLLLSAIVAFVLVGCPATQSEKPQADALVADAQAETAPQEPEQQEPEQVCPVDQFKDCMTCYVRYRFLCDGLKPENVNNLVFKRARRACLHGEDFVTNETGTPHRCAEHHLDHESELTQRCAVLWSTQGFRDAWREEIECR